MSVEDKIEYVQEFQVPVPDWHPEVLQERLADYQANPDQGRPWEEVEAELLKRQG